MTTSTLTGAAHRAALEVFTGRCQFALYRGELEEIDDDGYARVEGEMCAPTQSDLGGWAVWNAEAVEFPAFQASAEEAIGWLGVLDAAGTPLAYIEIEPFFVQPRLSPRFAIGKLVVRMGMV